MAGYAAEGYTEPMRALKEFKPKRFDLAILDIRMPRLNGFELYSILKNRDPELRTIFLTAYEIYKEEFDKLYGKSQFERFLQKPITAQDLIRHIESSLRRELE